MAPPQSDKKKLQVVAYLQHFQTATFFTQKELDKKCPVKLMSNVMKSTLDLIMADYPYLLDQIKCGILNIYFIYPMCNLRNIIKESDKLISAIKATTAEILDYKDRIKVEEESRVDFPGKKELLEEHKNLKLENLRLDAELSKFKKNHRSGSNGTNKYGGGPDASTWEDLHSVLNVITNNIELLVDYLCKNMQIESSELRRELEIPVEFKEFAAS